MPIVASEQLRLRCIPSEVSRQRLAVAVLTKSPPKPYKTGYTSGANGFTNYRCELMEHYNWGRGHASRISWNRS